jgi:hypothetical protein
MGLSEDDGTTHAVRRDIMTISEFVTQHGVTMDIERVGINPHWVGEQVPGTRHWRCVLKRGRKRLTIAYSQGPAIQEDPAVQDVLGSLVMDSTCGEESFEDFCSSMGYDTDSRTAERLYRTVQTQTTKVQRFLGDLLEEAQGAGW